MTFGNLNRRTVLGGLAGAGAVGALGISPKRANAANKGGAFRIGVGDFSTSDTIAPTVAETRFTTYLSFQVRNCLVEVGPGGVIVPELAESWGASADLKTWTFKIRNGVEFHNGKPLVAADVVYSLNLHRGDDTTSAIKSVMAAVSDIKATSDHEVVVTLDSANAGFPSILAYFQTQIVQDGDKNFDAGMGTGGYILESFEPGIRSKVKRNPNYWKADRAHFDTVELIAIKDASARTSAITTGEIDAMNFVDTKTAKLIARNPKVKVIRTPGKSHYAYCVRTDTAPFTNPDVRLALKYAIDRQDYLDKILSGFGTLGNDQPINAAYEYFNPNIPQREYDPDRAKSLMAKAGMSGETIKLHVADTPFSGATDGAVLFREHAAKAGINLEVVREPDHGYWSNVWANNPFFASRWSGRINEDLMFSTAYSKDALTTGWNETFWDNDAFNKILIAARSEVDDDKRRALYWECQTLINEEGGMIAPAFADFVDAAAANVEHGDLSSDWDLDGGRASERWWFS